MTEPETAAGRSLLISTMYRLEHDGEYHATDDEGILRDAILAIEAEARETARLDFAVIGPDNLAYLQGLRDGRAKTLDDVAAAVGDVPGEVGSFEGGEPFKTHLVQRGAILAAIDSLRAKP